MGGPWFVRSVIYHANERSSTRHAHLSDRRSSVCSIWKTIFKYLSIIINTLSNGSIFIHPRLSIHQSKPKFPINFKTAPSLWIFPADTGRVYQYLINVRLFFLSEIFKSFDRLDFEPFNTALNHLSPCLSGSDRRIHSVSPCPLPR